MATFNSLVDHVINESDILLMVVDARNVQGSINRELESRIIKQRKKYLYVINKADLITKGEQESISLVNSIQISAKKHWSTLRLLRKIMELSGGNQVIVGVVGYPNTGKSTLINSLKGRQSAPASSVSGYTRSLRKIRINETVMMIDTPGVIPFSRKGDIGLVKIGTINPEKLRDPEGIAAELITSMEGRIEKYFGVPSEDDTFDLLKKIALKKNILKKGGVPDTVRMARQMISLVQRGIIR